MSIYGKVHTDYLEIYCSTCNERTQNEFLGFDPIMPYFSATCNKCSRTLNIKFNNLFWKGFPNKRSETK